MNCQLNSMRISIASINSWFAWIRFWYLCQLIPTSVCSRSPFWFSKWWKKLNLHDIGWNWQYCFQLQSLRIFIIVSHAKRIPANLRTFFVLWRQHVHSLILIFFRVEFSCFLRNSMTLQFEVRWSLSGKNDDIQFHLLVHVKTLRDLYLFE